MIEFEKRLTDRIEYHREQTELRLAKFKKNFGVKHIVSLSGGADASVETTRKIVRELLQQFQGHDTGVAILTGGTKGGIPEMGLEVARECGLPTVAVFPQRARTEQTVRYDLIDLPIEALPPSVGKPTFGTETPTFAQIPDMAVIIGGKFGTLIEVATILKLNQSRIRHNETFIYICPILETGGIADIVLGLTILDPKLSATVIPEIRTGFDAGKTLLRLMEYKSKQIQEKDIHPLQRPFDDIHVVHENVSIIF